MSTDNPHTGIPFREALSRLGAAVNIITTSGPAGRHGITASAVCSVSDDPPTILVCINRHSGAHDHFLTNRVLCVNILAGRHESLSGHFGRRGTTPEERFSGADWQSLTTGAPALVGAVANLDCTVEDVKVVGTHSVLFCAVRHIEMAELPEGLIYFDRHYHHLGGRMAMA